MRSTLYKILLSATLLFSFNFSLADNSEKVFEVQENVVKNKIKVDDEYVEPTPEESYALKEKQEYSKLFLRLKKKYPEKSQEEIVAKMTEIWHQKKYIDYNANKAPKKTLNNEADKK